MKKKKEAPESELIKKEVHVIYDGYISSKEMYSPDCDVTKLIRSLWRDRKSRLVFEDMVTFKKFGWTVFYKGGRSSRLDLIDAIYMGEVEEE